MPSPLQRTWTILPTNGMRATKAARVWGAALSNRASNVNGPAVMRSLSMSEMPSVAAMRDGVHRKSAAPDCQCSEPQIAQARMAVRAAAQRPVIFALTLRDRQIVDTGVAHAHQAMRVEFPILVAIAAEPVAAIIVPFIGKAYRDMIVVKRPDLLDQAIVQLAVPFAHQERLDGVAALDEFRPVAPAAVERVGGRDAGRLAAVPRILGAARLLRGGRGGEGR